MSYYYPSPYNFTDHSLMRCRERLGLKEKDDFSVRRIVLELIKKSNHQFEDPDTLYIRAREQGNLFFVVTKMDHTIITCAPISIEKQMILSMKEE